MTQPDNVIDIAAARARFGAIPVNTPRDFGVFIWLYGKSNTGKSTLAAGIAKSKFAAPALIIDAEGGTRSINDIAEGVDFTPKVLTWPQIRQYVDIICSTSAKDLGYKTFIFDNMSEIAKINLNFHKKQQPYAEIQHYGYETVDIVKMTRDLRDRAREQPINIVCLSWDDQIFVTDTSGKDRLAQVRLDFNKQLALDIPGLLDIIGFTGMGLTPASRELSFAADAVRVSKFRKSPASKSRQIPDNITWNLTQAPLADILDVLRGGQPWPTDKYAPKPATVINTSTASAHAGNAASTQSAADTLALLQRMQNKG